MRGGRIAGAALVAAGLLASMATTALGGGWAVITLDNLPQGVIAGQTVTISFTVRQHGRTLLSSLDPLPEIEAHNFETGEVVRAIASDDGHPGHYSADLTLPSSGQWHWAIRAFGPEPQPMPTIVVGSAGRAAAQMPKGSAEAAPMLGAVVLAAIGIVLAFRRRLVWSGAALFVAKGCVACHINDRIPESEDASLPIGPDLSQYRNGPAFLARWLADPSAERPGTGMPDLDLSDAEIEALIAFLNGGGA